MICNEQLLPLFGICLGFLVGFFLFYQILKFGPKTRQLLLSCPI